jgi:threonine synthase
MIENGEIKLGEKMNVVVPTGNFGNILAAYYAKQMGVPINKLICASNKNRVLTDFINTGVYDRNREFFMTSSPSMDILISSNLERLLFLLSGKNDEEIASLMKQLSADGKYKVSEEVLSALQSDFAAGCCDDEETLKTIKELYEKYNYLCDTHTAVAVNVANAYIEKTGDKTPMVIASTANPYKFSKAVLSAVKSEISSTDEFSMVEELNEFTGVEVPSQLASLKNKTPRFNNVANKEDMPKVVLDMLGI